MEHSFFTFAYVFSYADMVPMAQSSGPLSTLLTCRYLIVVGCSRLLLKFKHCATGIAITVNIKLLPLNIFVSVLYAVTVLMARSNGHLLILLICP